MSDNAPSNPPTADVASLSFEAAQAELERIVEQLESPGTGLEQAIVLWERGEALHAHCKSRLDAALAKIEKIELAASEVSDEAQAGTDQAFEPAPKPGSEPASEPAREPAREPALEAQASSSQSTSDSSSDAPSESGPVPIF